MAKQVLVLLSWLFEQESQGSAAVQHCAQQQSNSSLGYNGYLFERVACSCACSKLQGC
jgi:hypothetical protein